VSRCRRRRPLPVDTAIHDAELPIPHPVQPVNGYVDLLSGSGLGSSEAYFVTQAPGICVAGGGHPVGQLEPSGPRTMCCKPGTVLQ
jgi:hypothetical protein